MQYRISYIEYVIEDPREDLKEVVQGLRKAVEDANQKARESAASLDKTIISLSGGALVFSMTFAHEIAPAKLYLPLLFVAWGLFAASIVCVLFSMKEGTKEDNLVVSKIYDGLTQAEQAMDAVRSGKVLLSAKQTNTLAISRHISILNQCAISAFLAGILIVGVFVGLNLWAKPKISEPPSPARLES